MDPGRKRGLKGGIMDANGNLVIAVDFDGTLSFGRWRF